MTEMWINLFQTSEDERSIQLTFSIVAHSDVVVPKHALSLKLAWQISFVTHRQINCYVTVELVK